MAMTEKHLMDPRRAGEVRRYHTFPVLHQQSVGEHTWQAMRVLCAIWPDAPRAVLLYAMVHDCGELRTGDIPYPHKGECSDAWRKEQNNQEDRALRSMCLPWGLPAPTAEVGHVERAVFKLAEYIEMWEYGLCERNRGNRYAHLIVQRCWDAIRPMLMVGNEVPQHVIEAASTYIERRARQEEEIRHD